MASLHGLGIWCCRELWCRSKTQLGSGVAVAVAVTVAVTVAVIGSLAWELPYATGAAVKKQKKKGRGEKAVKNIRVVSIESSAWRKCYFV